MFLLLLCFLMVGLLAAGITPDLYGGSMLVGLGWVAGYLDCRLFSRSDRDMDRVAPPDMNDPLDE